MAKKRSKADHILEELGCDHRWTKKKWGLNYCKDCHKQRYMFADDEMVHEILNEERAHRLTKKIGPQPTRYEWTEGRSV